jgi:hypothetical protein
VGAEHHHLGKFPAKPLQGLEAGDFHIENRDIGAMPDDRGAQFIEGRNGANGEVRIAERSYDHLSGDGIALKNNYTGVLHGIPTNCRRHGGFSRDSVH